MTGDRKNAVEPERVHRAFGRFSCGAAVAAARIRYKRHNGNLLKDQ